MFIYVCWYSFAVTASNVNVLNLYFYFKCEIFILLICVCVVTDGVLPSTAHSYRQALSVLSMLISFLQTSLFVPLFFLSRLCFLERQNNPLQIRFIFVEGKTFYMRMDQVLLSLFSGVGKA